jgi:hypothetical protein
MFLQINSEKKGKKVWRGNLNKVEWLWDCGLGQNCNSKDKLVMYNCSQPHWWKTFRWLAHTVKTLN